MKRILYVLALAAGLSIGARAEDWTGHLIDATCKSQVEKTASCEPTRATKVFALDVMGKIYKLDAAGNSKAAAALKFRPAPDPSKPASSVVTAKVTGTEAEGMIRVETISLQ